MREHEREHVEGISEASGASPAAWQIAAANRRGARGVRGGVRARAARTRLDRRGGGVRRRALGLCRGDRASDGVRWGVGVTTLMLGRHPEPPTSPPTSFPHATLRSSATPPLDQAVHRPPRHARRDRDSARRRRARPEPSAHRAVALLRARPRRRATPTVSRSASVRRARSRTPRRRARCATASRPSIARCPR